mmetsp:Transcript_461/g.1044  ORF Transcript_461/g.1044 Transcript_461/m.1044 type:complete len:288 (+) Transcript_461:198-1061(+)
MDFCQLEWDSVTPDQQILPLLFQGRKGGERLFSGRSVSHRHSVARHSGLLRDTLGHVCAWNVLLRLSRVGNRAIQLCRAGKHAQPVWGFPQRGLHVPHRTLWLAQACGGAHGPARVSLHWGFHHIAPRWLHPWPLLFILRPHFPQPCRCVGAHGHDMEYRWMERFGGVPLLHGDFDGVARDQRDSLFDCKHDCLYIERDYSKQRYFGKDARRLRNDGLSDVRDACYFALLLHYAGALGQRDAAPLLPKRHREHALAGLSGEALPRLAARPRAKAEHHEADSAELQCR